MTSGCRSDICMDPGSDCCAPHEHQSCGHAAYTPVPGGATNLNRNCPSLALYQCCLLAPPPPPPLEQLSGGSSDDDAVVAPWWDEVSICAVSSNCAMSPPPTPPASPPRPPSEPRPPFMPAGHDAQHPTVATCPSGGSVSWTWRHEDCDSQGCGVNQMMGCSHNSGRCYVGNDDPQCVGVGNGQRYEGMEEDTWCYDSRKDRLCQKSF